MKIKVSISRPYGSIEVEGESVNEIIEQLKRIPEQVDAIDSLIFKRSSEKAFAKVVAFSEKGDPMLDSKLNLTVFETISLLLYALKRPTSSREICRLLELNNRFAPSYASRLTDLKARGYVVKMGKEYRLTDEGKRFAESILARFEP